MLWKDAKKKKGRAAGKSSKGDESKSFETSFQEVESKPAIYQPLESPAANSQGCSRVRAGAHHVLVTLSISFPSDVPQPTSGPNVSDEDVCTELQADWAAKSLNKPEFIGKC
ncbi:hypothetical protein EI555_020319 [Monodon monoceros]|uniref:Uncharacterized protein n=1 Tax=Monodon monoceros TaxID=40151 RepID=A0A4U1F5U1_MONMO|nr:hypothetical protein EI555_020319 [Monodon monoceros]